MLGELDFYLPKSFCSTNVYGAYTEGKNLIVCSYLTAPFLLLFSAHVLLRHPRKCCTDMACFVRHVV